MTIDLTLFEQAEIDSRGVEPEAQRIAEELIVASELLDPPDSLRFLRALVAALQAEERTLAKFVDPANETRSVMQYR
jgi:hypothetical protein